MKCFARFLTTNAKQQKRTEEVNETKNYRNGEKCGEEEDPSSENLMITFAKWIFSGWKDFPQLSSEYLLLMAACKSTRDKTV